MAASAEGTLTWPAPGVRQGNAEFVCSSQLLQAQSLYPHQGRVVTGVNVSSGVRAAPQARHAPRKASWPDSLMAAARADFSSGRHDRALQHLRASVEAADDFAGWMAGAGLLRRLKSAGAGAGRHIRVAVLGSYTTSQLSALLPLAGLTCGLDIEVYEGGYGQFRQEIFDAASGLYAFGPDVVVLAVHAGDLGASTTASAEAGLEEQVSTWSVLWDAIARHSTASIVQHAFVAPAPETLGNAALRDPSSLSRRVHALNARFADVAPATVSFVDCDQLAASVGKQTWFSPRYWYTARQAVSLACIPLLARHTAAVIAARVGTSRKCLVLDLDGTLWGGVLGEDGVDGVVMGEGATGEAFSAFQRQVKQLKERGVILAVCSKNNPADVDEVFARRAEMVLARDDFAVLRVGWEDKPSQLQAIAAGLRIGVDSLVFADDNPAECELVRQLLPDVDVLELPAEPAEYGRVLASYAHFESLPLTHEDRERAASYQSRAHAAELEQSASSLEEFWRSLHMSMTVDRLADATTARAAQLIGKTNQFNLTLRRHTTAEVEAMAADPAWIGLCFRLADRFGDHGFVGLLLAHQEGDLLNIDTFLMSCRVIGRTVEDQMLSVLVGEAQRRGCTSLRGHFLKGPKNDLVSGLYPRLGFSDAEPSTLGLADEDCASYVLSLDHARPSPGFISVVADGLVPSS